MKKRLISLALLLCMLLTLFPMQVFAEVEDTTCEEVVVEEVPAEEPVVEEVPAEEPVVEEAADVEGLEEVVTLQEMEAAAEVEELIVEVPAPEMETVTPSEGIRSLDIEEVLVTITKPKIGAHPDYHPQTPAGANYEITADGCWWEDGNWHTIEETDVFEADSTYSLWIYLKGINGYTFTSIPETAMINEYNATVSLNATDGLLTLNVIFWLEAINTISLTITPPVVGAHPDYAPVLPDDADYESDAINTAYLKNGVRWDETDSWESLLVDSDTFQAGHAYSVTCFLSTWDSYEFSPDLTATINGKPATITFLSTSNTEIRIRYDFPVLTASGWQNIDGKWYYYENGSPVTGWKQIGGKWYWFQSGGIMQTGWKQISGKWYYFESGGAMVKGWRQISGKWYYFESGGAMVTGWKQISGKWYYFESGGAMVTGWKQISGKWYYFESGGAMVTGWKQIGGKWYYFESNGAMVTGWKKIGGKWYYFESGGQMVTGWKQIGGKWYYMDSSGVMLANTSTYIGGKIYNFDANGVCTNP